MGMGVYGMGIEKDTWYRNGYIWYGNREGYMVSGHICTFCMGYGNGAYGMGMERDILYQVI